MIRSTKHQSVDVTYPSSSVHPCLIAASQLNFGVSSSFDCRQGQRPPVPGQESAKLVDVEEAMSSRASGLTSTPLTTQRCATPTAELLPSHQLRHQLQNSEPIALHQPSHRMRSTSGTPRKPAAGSASTESPRRLTTVDPSDVMSVTDEDDDRLAAPLGFEPEGCCESAAVGLEINSGFSVEGSGGHHPSDEQQDRDVKSRLFLEVSHDSRVRSPSRWNHSSSVVVDVDSKSECGDVVPVWLTHAQRHVDAAVSCGNVEHPEPFVKQCRSPRLVCVVATSRDCNGLNADGVDEPDEHPVDKPVSTSRDCPSSDGTSAVGSTKTTYHYNTAAEDGKDVSSASCADQLHANSESKSEEIASACSDMQQEIWRHSSERLASSAVRRGARQSAFLPRPSRLIPSAVGPSSLPGPNEQRNLAEVDPKRFVALLCGKLNDIDSTFRQQKNQHSTNSPISTARHHDTSHLAPSSTSVARNKHLIETSTSLFPLRSFVTAAASSARLQSDVDDACADAILENHFRRVWNASSDDDIATGRARSDPSPFVTPSHVSFYVPPVPAFSSSSLPPPKNRVTSWNCDGSRKFNDGWLPKGCPATIDADLVSLTVPRVPQLLLTASKTTANGCSSTRVSQPMSRSANYGSCRRLTAVRARPATRPSRHVDGEPDEDSDCSTSPDVVCRTGSSSADVGGAYYSSSDFSDAYIPADSDATAALHDAVRRLERSSMSPQRTVGGRGRDLQRGEVGLVDCHRSSNLLACRGSAAAISGACRRLCTGPLMTCPCQRRCEDIRHHRCCHRYFESLLGLPSRNESSSADGDCREDFHLSQSTCCAAIDDDETFEQFGSLVSDQRCRQLCADRPTSTTAACGTTTSATSSPDVTVVGYYIGDESIPYRTATVGNRVTLAQFKRLLARRGNFRYFFKTPSDEFDSGAVLEEVFDDETVLPLWDGKIIGKVELRT